MKHRPATPHVLAFVGAACCFASAFGYQSKQAPADGPSMDGVTTIAAPGVPGPLSLLGEHARAVVAGKQGGATAAVVAATRLGEGRIVAFGHSGFSDAPDVADTRRMIRSAIDWARRCGEGPPAIAADGGWMKGLRALDFKPIELKEITADELAKIDLLCVTQRSISDREMDAIRAYVRSGGGMLASGLGWGWLQLNPGKTLDQHPLNRLLGEAGVLWADGTLDKTCDKGFSVGDPSPLLNAKTALDFVLSAAKGDSKEGRAELTQAAATLTLAVRTVPADDRLLLPRLRELLKAHDGELAPTDKKPLKAEDALSRLLLTLEVEQLRATPVDEVRAHPAARDFPGAVPDGAERIKRTLALRPDVPGWHSTGLYAAPGEVVSVEIPPAAERGKLEIRIGAHRDELWHHDKWKRVPEITLERPLTAATTHVASAFGGPIYLVVPNDCKLAECDVTISHAIAMPHYVDGKTDLAEWRERIRSAPAPWAELESDKIILTIPSRVVRDLENPDEVMKFWNDLSDAHATLAGIPLRRPRPERFVADVQISAGYMHSGCPIMTHLDVAEHFVDAKKLRGGDGWGFFHELGHNHQSGDWTFDGTGEVTCNLFALHAIDTICQPKPGTRGHGAVDKPPDVAKYIADGADFAIWKRDPFLALQMYVQLQKEFGWEPFKKVFAEYRDLPKQDRPKSDAEKRDQWMVRFSRTVGRNLGPFFERWGVPTSAEARANIASLPTWMPPELAADTEKAKGEK
ncbi:MAG: hypothetical protein HZB38_09810 [Planctomycetes bacterium]|nr:hypothetical protein [Planctomycetota bacterium]